MGAWWFKLRTALLAGMRVRRDLLLLGVAWLAYLAATVAAARAGSPLARPFSTAGLLLLIVTGFLLPWWGSLVFVAVTVLLVALAGPDSVNVHLTFGGPLLAAAPSLLIVECVLVGLGACAQLALGAARRAGREEGARVAAQEESRHLRLVLRSTSHEIGNVLTGLNLVIDHVRADLRDEETAARLARSSNRIRRLVGDLSDAAMAIEGDVRVRPRGCDLARIVRSLAEDFEDQARHLRLSLVVDAPPTLPVKADADRVEQVVANLLQNAFRYTPSGGEVRVRASRDAEGAIVEVRDTGLGLTPEQIDGLFRPFARFHAETAPGSGLGLWIVRNIMAAHGGTVEARSAGPRQGATFTLRFPPSPA